MRGMKILRQRLIDVTAADTDPVEKYYRIQFYQFIDRVSAEISDRFSVGSASCDLRRYHDLCRAIKSGEISAELKKYPDIDFFKLKIQMKAFRDETATSSLHDASRAYRNMDRQLVNSSNKFSI